MRIEKKLYDFYFILFQERKQQIQQINDSKAKKNKTILQKKGTSE